MPAEAEQPLETIRDMCAPRMICCQLLYWAGAHAQPQHTPEHSPLPCSITVYGWTRVATPTNSLTRDRGEPGDGGDLRGASSREFAWQRSRQKFPSGISRSSHRHVQSEDADDGTPKTAASLADTAALPSCEVASGELASCAALQQQAGLDDAFGIQRRATDDDGAVVHVNVGACSLGASAFHHDHVHLATLLAGAHVRVHNDAQVLPTLR